MDSEMGRGSGGMEVVKDDGSQPRWRRRRGFFMAHIILRLLAVISAVAAIPVMVTSDRHVLVYGIDFSARYSYFSALEFAIAVDAAVFAFSVGSIIFLCIGHARSTSGHAPNCLILYLLDMVMVALTMAACAAATSVGFIANYGVDEIGWAAVCDEAAQFCRQVLASLALSYVAFLTYLAIAAMSAYNLFVTR